MDVDPKVIQKVGNGMKLDEVIDLVNEMNQSRYEILGAIADLNRKIDGLQRTPANTTS